jgi:hypothetical protein
MSGGFYDEKVRKFQQSRRGLCYLDTAAQNNHTVLATAAVEANKSKYTNGDYSRAQLARKIQNLAGRPELKDFLRYLDSNSLPNCPTQRPDAVNADAMFGRGVASLKGKITRQQLQTVLGAVAKNLPKEIMEHCRDITLCVDIMFVNRIPFFMSISKKVRFITAEVLNNRKQGSLIKALQRICGVCRKRGFHITNIHGDGEFECTRGAVATDLRSELNICGKDEHVPDVERCIHTTKERTRCTYNSTPFNHCPPRMLIEIVFLNIFWWLNAFPHRLGVSQTLSPRTIVTGLHIDYTKHCRVEYGQCVQTHEKHDNSMTPRTVGALTLRPTGNAQGGHYFHSLMSGQHLHRTHWTELPMPAEVKDRVHGLARRANAHRGIKFTDTEGNDLDLLFPPSDDDDDSDYDPNHDDDDSSANSDDSSYNDDAATTNSGDNTGSVADEDHDNVAIIPDPPGHQPGTIAGVDDATAAATTNAPDDIPGVNENEPDDIPGVNENEPDIAGVDDEDDPTELVTYVNELETELDAEIDAINDGHVPESPPESDDEESHWSESEEEESASHENDDTLPRLLPRLRRNRKPSCKHLKGHDGDGSLPTVARPDEFKGGKHQAHVILQNIILTQYNLKQGIEKVGDDGKAAVLVELQQLCDRDVMQPVNKYYLTPAERKGALRCLMYLKEKRCETIKGRGCADGRSQRAHMTKEETSSPTVATEALILTCVIDATENRDVATCDIPGAFMQSDMTKGKVVMKLEGVMAEVILKIDPKQHAKYVERKREGRDVRHPREGPAWHPSSSPAILAESVDRI